MKAKSKSNRKCRSLKMESLENRELMAANVFLANRTLTINGTDGNDKVEVSSNRIHNRGALSLEVKVNDKVLATPLASSVDSIFANLGKGNDFFTFKKSAEVNRPNLVGLTINLGEGRQELVAISGVNVSNLAVNAQGSTHTEVRIEQSNISNLANVQLGNGNDLLRVASSSVNKLTADLRDGTDQMALSSRTSIREANVNLGKGNDKLITSGDATVMGGTIDGGDGIDNHESGRRNRPGIKARFLRFERGMN